MTNLPFVSLEQIELFLLVFFRTMGIIAATPPFANKAIPNQQKVGLSILVSLILFPVVPLPTFNAATELLPLLVLIFKEVMVGLVIGFVARLIFMAVEMAGQLVGVSIGFSIVNVFDPTQGTQVPIVSQLYGLIAILVFLATGAYQWFFQGLMDSFSLIPLAGMTFSGGLMDFMVRATADSLLIALKLAAPVLATMIFMDIIQGVMARTVPQMNIFVVGYPLKIGMGLLILGLSLTFFTEFFVAQLQVLRSDMYILMKAMGKG